MIHVVPDFYELRVWWRRVWPPARRREELALATAKLQGKTLSRAQGGAVWDLRARLWGKQYIGTARIIDAVPLLDGDFTNRVDFNRVAITPDGTVYAYRV